MVAEAGFTGDGMRIDPDLRSAVDSYLRHGYFVAQLSPAAARVVKPKRFNVMAAVLWLLFFGGGLFIYLIYYATSRDEIVDIVVTPGGQVQVNRQGPTPGETALGVVVILIIAIVVIVLLAAVFSFL
ncbi:MAG: hypothetical protein M9890_04090 [Thermomicrobiales bacterium]|nr:hypothetical protein [Thermomicrobiales bacterium]